MKIKVVVYYIFNKETSFLVWLTKVLQFMCIDLFVFE